MRVLTVATLFVLGLGSASEAANDGPWCYRDFGGPQYANCTYYSIRECLTAAGVLGGVCERNHRPFPEEAKKGKRKSPKQARAPQT
jgi:hypothetical protein